MSRLARTNIASVVGLFGVVLLCGFGSSGFGGGATAAWAAGSGSIITSSTTPQNTDLGTAFADDLVAVVSGISSGGSCPASVDFSAPASGPSAVFSSSGTYTTSVSPSSALADASGDCTYDSPTLVANDEAGSYLVVASAGGVGGSASFSLVNDGISSVSGSSQTTRIATGFSQALQVVVYSNGEALSDASVSFAAPTSGPSGVFSTTNTYSASSTTNSSGIATAPSFVANDEAGSYLVSATSSTVGGTAYFYLTNTAAGVSQEIVAYSGTPQAGRVGDTYGLPLQAKVSDVNGNPVQGATVIFSVSSSPATSSPGASFAGSGSTVSETTDSAGIAISPRLAANDVAGAFHVTAATQGVTNPAVFSLTNEAGAPASVTPGVGSSQQAGVGSAFAIPLSVTVADSYDNPVPGVRVSFAAPSSGPSGTFSGISDSVVASVLTNSDGVAVAPSFVANDITGGYIVTASVGGLSPPGSFSLVNEASGSSPTVSTSTGTRIVGMASTPDGRGYWLVASDGGIFSFGDATFYGSMGAKPLDKPIVGMASTPDGRGYWLVASDGGIFSFGDATFYGSMGAKPLDAPIVGMASTPDGRGYWLVASDGGVFSFGDATFYGSMGAKPLDKPIVGMASTPDGRGYWLVASDGGIFSFGDATFYGSMGAKPLDAAIVGMASTPDGRGYWLVASDGGVFSFGDATFYGSMGAKPLDAPMVGISSTPNGAGYWEVAKDGGVFAFAQARFFGSG